MASLKRLHESGAHQGRADLHGGLNLGRVDPLKRLKNLCLADPSGISPSLLGVGKAGLTDRRNAPGSELRLQKTGPPCAQGRRCPGLSSRNLFRRMIRGPFKRWTRACAEHPRS
jgi:hypothetical protein